MNVFGNSSKQLLQALTANAEKETMDYVLQEMQAVLGEEMPETDAVRTYLQDPDKPTELSTAQQIVGPICKILTSPRSSAQHSRSWPWTSCWSVRRSISERSVT